MDGSRARSAEVAAWRRGVIGYVDRISNREAARWVEFAAWSRPALTQAYPGHGAASRPGIGTLPERDGSNGHERRASTTAEADYVA